MMRTRLTLAPLVAVLAASLLTPPSSLRAAQAPASTTTATQEADRTRLRVEKLASEAFAGLERAGVVEPDRKREASYQEAYRRWLDGLSLQLR